MSTFNAVELEIELFCRGCRLSDLTRSQLVARRITRTRAGLGSGLEIVIPDEPRDVHLNVPVDEPFAGRSPFSLVLRDGSFVILDDRTAIEYPIRIPREPAWYGRHTARGTEMCQVGVLQGSYLGIFLSNTCFYWYSRPEPTNCRFCTTGKNVGVSEVRQKHVDDVVEVARAAQVESGSVFTHFNTGYQFEEDATRRGQHGLMRAKPYVEAVRRQVGGFIGLQSVPVPRSCWDEYDQVIEAGVDHLSFCVELLSPEVFARICPGKHQTVGQAAFFSAMSYAVSKLGKGRVAGELIAGLEPIERTKEAIDLIVDAGAFPTVCIFRPLIGSDLSDVPPPEPDEMREVMAYQYTACRRAGIPIGVLPIDVSLVVHPEEGRRLLGAEQSRPGLYEAELAVMKQLARPYVAWKLRPSCS